MDTEPQTLISNFPSPHNQSVDLHAADLLRETVHSGSKTPTVADASRPLTGLVAQFFTLPGKLLGWWHLTSLDAPTVAVCWSLALARVSAARLPLWAPIALGLGTWSIYLGDRLMDAKRALAPLRERHWFHWQHRRVLLPAAILSLVAALALVLLNMPPAIRDRDAVLALAAAVYFVAIHTRRNRPTPGTDPDAEPFPARPANRLQSAARFLSKETCVGLIFALVCAAPAATRAPGSFAVLIAPVAACFLLAWLNCRLIERWDANRSGGTGNQLALAAASAIAALPAFACHAPQAALFLFAIAASALLLAALDRHRLRLTGLHLRAAADLVLLTPLLLILLAPLLLLAPVPRGWR